MAKKLSSGPRETFMTLSFLSGTQDSRKASNLAGTSSHTAQKRRSYIQFVIRLSQRLTRISLLVLSIVLNVCNHERVFGVTKSNGFNITNARLPSEQLFKIFWQVMSMNSQ